ncbi:DUF882 domain-containing protein [Hyphomicrobium sulfonivorans]|uniref:DUF882 domain-containing protein n=1 Tax=Hyphomicrobium sulfonivorans TaxID=121290 RepID=UPI00156E8688|nr:DUF882 domain-containing protein [Hyphomicrobium sulfonivorans]MBI1649363.1 DUF882 domain-containing protein [Hyphomicrobium sulfonivorans]NSL71281.1 hypothetical protein [Hyphomicrobium sulfonivorans]
MLVAWRDGEGARRLNSSILWPVGTRGGTLVSRRNAILGGFTAAVLLGLSAGPPDVVAAFGSTRTISLYHIHTKENISVTYKRNGKWDEAALKQLNWFLRDWRVDKATEIDRNTIDILWEMHTELGSRKPIHIISAYRSPHTNEMLRKTRGGQAKKSRHMTGQAIDATFPDVSLKRMRYSAIIRERGGVGYYPTSGIPFVHVDTGPVRAWPRLARNELALLFPNGHSKHRPSSGGELTPGDVRKARQNKDLVQQIAAFHEQRKNPQPVTIVAEAQTLPPIELAPAPAPAEASRPSLSIPPAPIARQQLASIGMPALVPPAPTLAKRPIAAVPPPSDVDRGRLNHLVTLASLGPSEVMIRTNEASAADRRQLEALVRRAAFVAPDAPMSAAMVEPPAKSMQTAALSLPHGDNHNHSSGHGHVQPGPIKLEPGLPLRPGTAHDAGANENGRWASAPEFDDDHPEELSYRPFPVAPFLTQSASADDEVFLKLVHPDLHRTLDLLDDKPIVLPMRLRPGDQIGEVLWAQQFKGSAVDFSAHEQQAPGTQAGAQVAGAGMTSRSVRTSAR